MKKSTKILLIIAAFLVLAGALLFVCVMLTTSAFMFFTPVQLLCTGGTPGNSTKVMLLYIYENGIQKGNIGAQRYVDKRFHLLHSGLQILQDIVHHLSKAISSSTVVGNCMSSRSSGSIMWCFT